MFNAESVEELAVINKIAGEMNLQAPVSMRLNPDVDAKTHAHIRTGRDDHKFGIPFEHALRVIANRGELPQLKFIGIDCHIGSNITDLSAFREAFRRMRGWFEQVRAINPSLRYLDIGGGLGVQYQNESAPAVEEYAAAVKDAFSALDCSLLLEPGRSLFADSGLLLTKVLYLKQTLSKTFVVLDAGFNDLLRPLLYDAYHEIIPVDAKQGVPEVQVDVVGPICETGDCFAKARTLPKLAQGDLVAIMTAGAYGFTMTSNYNSRPRPPEIAVGGSSAKVIRPRETVESLFTLEAAALADL
jgi:diaminopimelate decarboxylase